MCGWSLRKANTLQWWGEVIRMMATNLGNTFKEKHVSARRHLGRGVSISPMRTNVGCREEVPWLRAHTRPSISITWHGFFTAGFSLVFSILVILLVIYRCQDALCGKIVWVPKVGQVELGIEPRIPELVFWYWSIWATCSQHGGGEKWASWWQGEVWAGKVVEWAAERERLGFRK